MAKLAKILDRLLGWILALLAAVMVFSMFLQVVGRVIIQHGYPWTEEMSILCMYAVVFLGAIGETARRGHISITVLESMLTNRPGIRRALNIIQDLATLAFALYTSYWGLESLKIVQYQGSPNMEIPMHYVYGVMPLSFICISVILLVRLGLTVAGKENKGWRAS